MYYNMFLDIFDVILDKSRAMGISLYFDKFYNLILFCGKLCWLSLSLCNESEQRSI